MKKFNIMEKIDFETRILKIQILYCGIQNKTVVKFYFYKDSQHYVNNQHKLSYNVFLNNDNMLEVFNNIYIRNKKITSLRIIDNEELSYKQNFEIDKLSIELCGENNYKLTFYNYNKPVLVSDISECQYSNTLLQLYELL